MPEAPSGSPATWEEASRRATHRTGGSAVEQVRFLKCHLLLSSCLRDRPLASHLHTIWPAYSELKASMSFMATF